MANMNKKGYWKARKLIKTILFRIKVFLFRIVDMVESFWEYHPFRRMILRSILSGGIIALILAICVLLLDSLSFRILPCFGIEDILTVDPSIFVDVVIGSIGVAGVILGLYCANVSSIYSTRYANAPEKLAIAFQFDRLTRKCMSSIISFIILGFAVIIEALLGLNIGWLSVITVILWAIYVLVSYSIAGNRAYQLSDIYRLADDSYRDLYKIINRGFKRDLFSTDVNFQNHYLKEAEKKTELLKAIQKYGENENHGDNGTMVEFICKNILLIGEYWKSKTTIAKTSLWFRNEAKYKKWHLSDGTETELALRTGTALGTKNERNYWWFEDEIKSVINSCFEVLVEKHDYSSFYSCLLAYEKICGTAISYKEVGYYAEQVNWIKNLVKKNQVSELDDETKTAYAGVIEVISLLYLGIVLEATKFYSDYNIEKIVNCALESVDTAHTLKKSTIFSGSNNVDFYDKILTEIRVEGHRITPTWVIAQCVANEEYNYLNRVIETVCDGFEQVFSLGKEFLEKKQLLESCILFSRFFEFESKLNRFIEIVQIREHELRSLQIDKELVWDEFRIGKLKETYEKWKITVPELLLKSSSEFALINWENRDAFPDFLGESYNHICEDAIDSITSNNIIQFEQDFINLSKLMLLYQEYIRTDFLNEIGKYRTEYVYYMYTSPIVEWAQIGGLAILWGEFGADNTWFEKVDNGAKLIFTKNGEVTDLAEKIIQYIQNRDKFMLGIGSRDILETDWNISVANAIRDCRQLDVEYGIYGLRLKTSSKLLHAFCSDFTDMGFMSDPAEVFWVLCVNPLLPKEKQFHTRFSWEDKINE